MATSSLLLPLLSSLPSLPSVPSESQLVQSLKRRRDLADEGKEEENESYESKTKQPFTPSSSSSLTGELRGDSRWRCVPGVVTRQCVEYKIGDVTNGLLNSMLIGQSEEEKLRSLKNVGIYTDYPSRESCEATCTSLPIDPLALAMSMLNAQDVRSLVRATQNFPRVVNDLKDTYKQGKETQLLEEDIVFLLGITLQTSIENLLRIADRTFGQRIEQGEGRLFSKRISHSIINIFDSNPDRRTTKYYFLRNFLITKMLQTPGWQISNADRVYLFTSNYSAFVEADRQLADKTEWLKLGLLKTLDPNNPQDQKLVLRRITVMDRVANLFWILTNLIPYFEKYNFADDPTLVAYLWGNFPWNFAPDLRMTPNYLTTLLELNVSLWQLLDQLHILLTKPVNGTQLLSSPVFDDATYRRPDENYLLAPIDTKEIITKLLILVEDMPLAERATSNEIIQQALKILSIQPYYNGENLSVTFPLMLQARENQLLLRIMQAQAQEQA